MDYNKIKEKAANWLQEIKDRYNYKDIEPCDFLLPDLTVLDLIMIADDVQMLSEMMMVHGQDSVKLCICDALSYIPELHKNECYKTLRAAEIFEMKNCVKQKKEMMSSMLSPLTEKLKSSGAVLPSAAD